MSILLIEPIKFGSSINIKDNSFASTVSVSTSQNETDHCQALHVLSDLRERLREHHCSVHLVRLACEKKRDTLYKDKGDAIFPNNYISLHNFVDAEGNITRRVAILYPMSTYRQNELADDQILHRLEKASSDGTIQLVDLRSYQSEGRCLEGTGAINFSHDGRFAYMSRSQRTDSEIFDIVCSPENLNIPAENRFCFTSAVPKPDRSENLVYHTNVVGWCGKGICAWGLDCIRFDSEEERLRFHRHLEQEYTCLIRLSQAEIESFAGNSLEIATRDSESKEHRVLCMSKTAFDGLSRKNRQSLEGWYGARNLLSFYGDTIERRTGGSIRCLMCSEIAHGPSIPASNQTTLLDAAGIN